ncbi:MAG: transcription elongation factor GreA [Dehalococcoidia bacterium]|nr:transcription elongation factor GreA [Dehalococcoidia bacterium]
MPSKRHPHSSNTEISLGEAASQFLSTVPTELTASAQQDVFKFIRWYGESRNIASLIGQEVANYSEQMNTTSTISIEHLNIVKQFLSFAHKQGFTSVNLAPHIRVKKLASKISAKSAAKIEDAIILTSQGYEEMKVKLAILKEERPKIAEELKKAAADKDFRENAPLEAARERQGHVEGQIRELENTLKRAKVAETVNGGVLRITIGDAVTIVDISSEEKIRYMLVGSKEANIKLGKISIVSPMGQALFNKQIGDVFKVNAPSCILKYKILEISRI